jgi:eukaryotic-like serine/threonine-protein kinase
LALDLGPGTVVADRYRLERLLGEGGMGSVWAATHTVTHKALALKFLKGAVESPELRRRFVREARTACAVDHPNVREVHDVLEIDGGLPVLVMERLEGESLGQRLSREETLPVEEACRILLPVVSAVGTAHALGIVHRDLKPENIFLTEGKTPEVKVLDFGIAKLTPLEEHGADSAVTTTGMMFGTPCYMSPEQVFGEKDADHRVDIWALGLILYRALSGVLPTQGDNIGQVMKVIVTTPIRPVEELASDVPADLAALVARMLSRDRGDRPADLREVYELLSKHTDAEAPDFGPPASALVRPSAVPARARDEVALPGDTTVIGDDTGTVHPLPVKALEPRLPARMLWLGGLAVVAIGAAVWALQRDPGLTPPIEPAEPPSVASQAASTQSPEPVPSAREDVAPPSEAVPAPSSEARPPPPLMRPTARATAVAPPPSASAPPVASAQPTSDGPPAKMR